MGRFQASRGLKIGTLLLALGATEACAPPDGLQSADGTTQAAQHSVPFHDPEGKPGSPGDSSAAQGSGLNREAELPFQPLQNLPAGTLLTVRTRNSISIANPDANGTFEAVVDQPVIIEGNRLVPLGATVSGRVESARASSLKRNRGYVRLTLESIRLGGANLPVQTSSLFVRGNAGLTPNPESPIIRLEKGRRLVFRLTEPVYVAASQPSPAEH